MSFSTISFINVCLSNFLKFIYMYFEREWLRGRGRGRKNPEQTLHCQHRALCRLKLMNHEIMTWAEIKSHSCNWLSHPGDPGSIILNGSLFHQNFTLLFYFIWHRFFCFIFFLYMLSSLDIFSISFSFKDLYYKHTLIFWLFIEVFKF